MARLPGSLLALLPRLLSLPLLSLPLLSLLLAPAPTLAQDKRAAAPVSRLERVQAVGRVRVCIWPDYYGISYLNPKTQLLSGIDVEMAREFATDLGVKLEFVDSSFSRLVADVSEDRCDVAMFGIGITAPRAAVLRFTRPYLRSDIYAVTTRSNRRIRDWNDIDKPGVIVAVAKGTIHETIMRERLKAATLRVFDTPHAREEEVESGRADVFMTDYPYGQRMLDTVEWARLIAPPGVFQQTSYAWAVKPGDDRWYGRLERFLSDIKRDGRLAAAARRNRLDAILIND